ncbi:hypothetical protein QP185_15075 [Sphingomonas aerolata]|uniref:hypothetical protein n=1 Tax=Sphingomonas aerolata TaxID=185951 RepID=UPI002FE28913
MTTTPSADVAPISRAMNVRVTEAQAVAMCAKHKAEDQRDRIAAVGGTRIVLMNIADAATVAKAFGSKVLTGTVQRTGWIRAR